MNYDYGHGSPYLSELQTPRHRHAAEARVVAAAAAAAREALSGARGGQHARLHGLRIARAEGIVVRGVRGRWTLSLRLLLDDVGRQAHADLPGDDDVVSRRHRHDERRGHVRRRADAVA